MKNIDETEGRIGFYEVDEDEVCDDTLKIPVTKCTCDTGMLRRRITGVLI